MKKSKLTVCNKSGINVHKVDYYDKVRFENFYFNGNY